MARSACRITLAITEIRVERLQQITEADAMAEGVEPSPFDPEGDCWTDGKYVTAFQYHWGEINGWEGDAKARAPWQSNPWVWAINFKVKPEGEH
jgi:hypothetical protein